MAGVPWTGASRSQPDVIELATLSSYLAHWASERPNDVAVVSGADRLSWLTLRERVERCASGLAGLGVGRGDVVAMLAPQRWEFVVVYLALDRLQAIFLGLNTRHQMPELELVLNDARPSILLTIGEFNGRDYLRDAQNLRRRCPSIRTLVDIDGAAQEGLTLEDLLSAGGNVSGLPEAVSATEAACHSPRLSPGEPTCSHGMTPNKRADQGPSGSQCRRNRLRYHRSIPKVDEEDWPREQLPPEVANLLATRFASL